MLEIRVPGIDRLTVDLSVTGANNDPLLAYLYIERGELITSIYLDP